MNKPIRHLSASNKSLVAAGAFEKDVEVWDIEARVKVSAFQLWFCH